MNTVDPRNSNLIQHLCELPLDYLQVGKCEHVRKKKNISINKH